MAEITRRRSGEMLRSIFKILLPHPEGLPVKDVIQGAADDLELTPFEASSYPNLPEVPRYQKILRFVTITSVKANWLIKDKGIWRLTDAGRRAYEQIPDPEAFIRESIRLYKEWAKSRGGSKTGARRSSAKFPAFSAVIDLTKRAEASIGEGDYEVAYAHGRVAASELIKELAHASDQTKISEGEARRFVAIVSALARTLASLSNPDPSRQGEASETSPPSAGERPVGSPAVWVVRGGSNGEFISDFVSQEVVAIGFGVRQSLAGFHQEQISKVVEEFHPNKSLARKRAIVGLLNTFVNELRDGDFVISPERRTRKLWVFQIDGAYQYRPDEPISDFRHVRSARFLDWHFRDVISEATRRSLGGQQTVYSPKDQNSLLELARRSQDSRTP